MATKQESKSDVREFVRQRYGKLAVDFHPQSTASCCGPVDQSTSSCCSSESDIDIDQISRIYQAPDAAALPDEVTGLSLGCGDPVTLALLQPGQTVLDLGSGGGIDCFLAAKRVGPSGHVIGVDMTPEMLDKARANRVKVGAENVEFRLGEIEHLPVSDDSVDVIISNCVINLSPDKPQVFREAYRALKSGGRLAVSDIVTAGPLPGAIKESLSAWAGCVAGALQVDDYIGAMQDAGFVDIQVKPVYFDKQQIDSALDQLDLNVQDQGARLVIREGADVQVVELDVDDKIDVDNLHQAIFSANITARKP